MNEEIIPNDGRVIGINSSTAKSIIEGLDIYRLKQLYQDKHCDNLQLRKALEEIREIIHFFSHKNSSLDWEAKAHRAIEIVKQINEVLKDE